MTLFSPDDTAQAVPVVDRLGDGPMRYARAAVAIARMDTDAIGVISRDKDAIWYGAVLMMATSACATVLRLFLAPSLGALIAAFFLVPVFALIVSLITTAAIHGAAKMIFGATGTYVGLLRVLWLGSLVNVLLIIPVLGQLVAGLWSTLIMMVTFQEVDGIERIQALGLSLGLTAAVYFIGMMVAQALQPLAS